MISNTTLECPSNQRDSIGKIQPTDNEIKTDMIIKKLSGVNQMACNKISLYFSWITHRYTVGSKVCGHPTITAI